jgi:hypothetical protein
LLDEFGERATTEDFEIVRVRRHRDNVETFRECVFGHE